MVIIFGFGIFERSSSRLYVCLAQSERSGKCCSYDLVWILKLLVGMKILCSLHECDYLTTANVIVCASVLGFGLIRYMTQSWKANDKCLQRSRKGDAKAILYYTYSAEAAGHITTWYTLLNALNAGIAECST